MAANVPSQIGVPGGAPGSALGVTMYLSQLVQSLNLWIARAANAINGQWTTAPAHSTSPGTQYQLATDGSYLYVCVAQNHWARVAIGGSW